MAHRQPPNACEPKSVLGRLTNIRKSAPPKNCRTQTHSHVPGNVDRRRTCPRTLSGQIPGPPHNPFAAAQNADTATTSAALLVTLRKKAKACLRSWLSQWCNCCQQPTYRGLRQVQSRTDRSVRRTDLLRTGTTDNGEWRINTCSRHAGRLRPNAR